MTSDGIKKGLVALVDSRGAMRPERIATGLLVPGLQPMAFVGLGLVVLGLIGLMATLLHEGIAHCRRPTLEVKQTFFSAPKEEKEEETFSEGDNLVKVLD